eukprot:Opistho-1_new@65572
MKKYVLSILILVCIFGYAQPGALHKNLNEDFTEADVIVIDSTSDLSRVNLLKDLPSLILSIRDLKEIPKEFKGFTKTTYLMVSFWQTGITDLSFFNEFPHLTHLRIWEFGGDRLATKPLKLDTLRNLEIAYSHDLEDIESIKKLNSLQELRIDNCAYIKAFPRFGKENSIRKLTLDHMANGRYRNENVPKKQETKITNIGYLNHLEELVLGSLTHIHEIPSYLPRSIKKLEITGWGLHHWKGDKVVLNSVSNLKLYPNLKELKLYTIHLEKFTGNFGKLSLDNLVFSNVSHLTNISGAFTFKRVSNIGISGCIDLKTISGSSCTSLETLEIADSPNIEDIDFLFTCTGIKNLIFRNAEAFRPPNRFKTANIPNIAIHSDNQKIYWYKKDSKWIKPEE